MDDATRSELVAIADKATRACLLKLGYTLDQGEGGAFMDARSKLLPKFLDALIAFVEENSHE